MSHLTPVKRLDKNNRLVTRHVRDEKVNRGAAIPKPASPAIPDTSPTYEEIAETNPLMVGSRESRRTIEKMHPAYRTRLKGFLSTEASNSVRMPQQLMDADGNPLLPSLLMDAADFEATLPDTSRVYLFRLKRIIENSYHHNRGSITRKAGADGAPTAAQVRFIKSRVFYHVISGSEDAPPRNLDQEMRRNWELIEPAVSLIILRGEMNGRSDGLENIVETARFAEQHRENMDFILNFVTERGDYNEDMISDALENPSLALSDGVL